VPVPVLRCAAGLLFVVYQRLTTVHLSTAGFNLKVIVLPSGDRLLTSVSVTIRGFNSRFGFEISLLCGTSPHTLDIIVVHCKPMCIVSRVASNAAIIAGDSLPTKRRSHAVPRKPACRFGQSRLVTLSHQAGPDTEQLWSPWVVSHIGPLVAASWNPATEHTASVSASRKAVLPRRAVLPSATT
jgi:hypothetical protein